MGDSESGLELGTNNSRVFNEIKLEELKIAQIKQEYEDEAIPLSVKKGKFSQMKYNLLESEAKSILLQNLLKEPADWLTLEQANSDLTTTADKLKTAKEENAAVMKNISEKVEKSVEVFSNLEVKIKAIEENIQKWTATKEKVEQAKAKKEKEIEKQRKLKEETSAKQGDLEKLEDLLDTCQRSIHTSHTELQDLKRITEELRLEVKQQKDSLTEHQHKEQSQLNSKTSSLESAIKNVNKLDGHNICVHHMDRCSMVLEFSDVTLPSLFLNIQLYTTSDNRDFIKMATINVDYFSVDDLVKTEKHCLPSFIHKVYQRWQETTPSNSQETSESSQQNTTSQS